MDYRVTVDEVDIFRVEDADGHSVTVGTDHDLGTILSINGSEEDGARSLLDATLAVSTERGIKRLEMDYLSDFEGIDKLLDEAGFSKEDGARVYQVSVEKLLSSVPFEKAMRCRCPGTLFFPLKDIFITQLEELEKLFGYFFINLSLKDLQRFSKELSGVAYDNGFVPKAVVLCSETEDTVNVDFLFGVSKKEPQYIMAALQGMMRNLSEPVHSSRIKKLTLIGANEITTTLLMRTLDGSYSPQVMGVTKYAYKDLEDSKDVEYITDLDESKIETWKEEAGKVPAEANAVWKMSWYRNKSAAKKEVRWI
jgi:hypothetical protein